MAGANGQLTFQVEKGHELASSLGTMFCRSCGAFARVSESVLVYADGQDVPQEWDGTSQSVVPLSNAKKLAFPGTVRDRLFLFGDEPYTTGTVDTVGGVVQINKVDGNWPNSVLGKAISIDGVSFGSDGACQSVIKNINGKEATLSDPPNSHANNRTFIVHGGTDPSVLQWSDVGDHTTFSDAAIPVGQADGDIPSGLFVIADFVVMAKRGRLYRFDFDERPSADGIITEISSTRGLLSNKCAVVVDGLAYCMDQFPGSYFYITAGSRLFTFNIGKDIADAIEGTDYTLDWSKAVCWFAWFSPDSYSVCWAVTRDGEPYPDIVIEYFRPNVEGGDEPGRWNVREYDHYLLAATEAVVCHDGVSRPVIVCADKENSARLFLTMDGGKYGDMALKAEMGSVVRKVTENVYELGEHTEFERGQIVEVGSQALSVDSDDTETGQTTFTADFEGDVVGSSWLSGWRKMARFRTTDIRPVRPEQRVCVSQVHLDFEKASGLGFCEISVHPDGNMQFEPLYAGGSKGDYLQARFRDNELGERVISISPGSEGYGVQVEIGLKTPDGTDYVHSMSVLALKQTEGNSGPQSW